MDTIYLDNAATTQMRPEVLDAMMPYFTEHFGNASSIYPVGQYAAAAVRRARAQIAGAINAKPDELFFTSGGSESDNWALKGVMSKNAGKGKHLITTAIEHHAILHTGEFLQQHGFDVTYLPVDEEGLVSVEDFEAAIRPDTVMASVMFANNEIGTIEPIAQLGAVAHDHGLIFHVDAVQAFGHVPIDVDKMNIDLLSASAHKIYGPKGVGFLYRRKGVRIDNLVHGGAQEKGLRAGTENVAGIVGFAKATEMALAEQTTEIHRQSALRDHAINRILAEIPYSRVNGSRTHRLPNNINVAFQFIEGEGMLMHLAAKGVCSSSGSACTSGSLDPSHVLLAIGLPHERAHGSLRLTLGHSTTLEQIDYTIDQLVGIVANLRNMSPLYKAFCKQNKIA